MIFKYVWVFISLMVMTQAECATQPQTVTIFIHGTLPPVINHLIHTFDCPLGLTPAKQVQPKFIQSKIPYTLAKYGQDSFSLEQFYLFGWSGNLSAPERKKAAHDLYHALKKVTGPITLICHSHGCNVALNLIHIAHKHKDTTFSIEKLILLAGPVQEATKNLTHAPAFRKIYSFYSPTDLTQIADPQGLYQSNKSENFFSQRLWPDAPHIIQTKVSFGSKGLWHTHFIAEKFLKHLPSCIEQLDKLNKELQKNHFELVINKHTNSFEIR